MRSFIAIPLSEDARDALCGLQSGLRIGRPVARGNLHLTLAFLGDQPVPVLEDLHAELDLLSLPSFPLVFRGTGSFGGAAPKVVFAGVEAAPGLHALHRGIRGALRRARLFLAEERFRPHVTIARLKPQDGPGVAPFLEANARFHHEDGPARSFALFESVLRPAGPQYRLLAEYPLAP